MSEGLKYNTTLSFLNLYSHNSKLSWNKRNGKDLFLSDNAIGDEGLKKIGEGLKYNSTLTELDLSCEKNKNK